MLKGGPPATGRTSFRGRYDIILRGVIRWLTHLQKLLSGWNEAGVADDRLEDNSGYLALVGLKDLLHLLQVIVRGAQRGGCAQSAPRQQHG